MSEREGELHSGEKISIDWEAIRETVGDDKNHMTLVEFFQNRPQEPISVTDIISDSSIRENLILRMMYDPTDFELAEVFYSRVTGFNKFLASKECPYYIDMSSDSGIKIIRDNADQISYVLVNRNEKVETEKKEKREEEMEVDLDDEDWTKISGISEKWHEFILILKKLDGEFNIDNVVEYRSKIPLRDPKKVKNISANASFKKIRRAMEHVLSKASGEDYRFSCMSLKRDSIIKIRKFVRK